MEDSLFTLYVAHDKRRPERHDMGSVLCLSMLRFLPEGAVAVVDCTTAGAARPSWLRGTPTLTERASHTVWTGHNAHDRLLAFTVQHAAAARNHKNTANSGSARRALQSPPGASAPQANDIAVGDADGDDGDGDCMTNAALWDNIPPDADDEDDGDGLGGNAKLTSDDLRAAADRRNTAHHPPSGGPQARLLKQHHD